MILLNEIWGMTKYAICGTEFNFQSPLETKRMIWVSLSQCLMFGNALHFCCTLSPQGGSALGLPITVARANYSAICHFLSIMGSFPALRLSPSTDCHQFCMWPVSRRQTTQTFQIEDRDVPRINTSVWAPNFKVGKKKKRKEKVTQVFHDRIISYILRSGFKFQVLELWVTGSILNLLWDLEQNETGDEW